MGEETQIQPQVEVKKTRGRPKGSKNKPKLEETQNGTQSA